MQNIENFCEILSLMSFKIPLNCPEMTCTNDIINDIIHQVSFQAFPVTKAKPPKERLW